MEKQSTKPVDSFKEGFFKLAYEYRLRFEEEGDAFLLAIGKFDSIRNCLLLVYNHLVKDGHCLPIEDLPQEEKLKLWEEAKRISSVNRKDYVIDVCKAIHAFGTYIQL